MTLAEATQQMLEPHVGLVIAQGCLRAISQATGKPPEAVDAGDWHAVEGAVRGFLRPVAPPATIEALVGRIREAGGA